MAEDNFARIKRGKKVSKISFVRSWVPFGSVVFSACVYYYSHKLTSLHYSNLGSSSIKSYSTESTV